MSSFLQSLLESVRLTETSEMIMEIPFNKENWTWIED